MTVIPPMTATPSWNPPTDPNIGMAATGPKLNPFPTGSSKKTWPLAAWNIQNPGQRSNDVWIIWNGAVWNAAVTNRFFTCSGMLLPRGIVTAIRYNIITAGSADCQIRWGIYNSQPQTNAIPWQKLGETVSSSAQGFVNIAFPTPIVIPETGWYFPGGRLERVALDDGVITTAPILTGIVPGIVGDGGNGRFLRLQKPWTDPVTGLGLDDGPLPNEVIFPNLYPPGLTSAPEEQWKAQTWPTGAVPYMQLIFQGT